MRIVMAALVLALAAPMAHAQGPDANGFYRYTTDTGCLFLLDIEPQDNVKGHIWSGDCRPGQLITGTGSIITLTDSYVDDRGATVQDARTRTGPWVNGLMHGRFKFDNVTSTNGGPWTVIPDDCGESWCRGIFFTHNMGVVDYDSAVWGHVDTLQAAAPAAPAARTPATAVGSGGGTSVQSSRSPVNGGGAPASRFADDDIIRSVSLADIERLMADAGFASGLSGDYPGHLQATHPNGVRFYVSGIACDDPENVKGCAGLILFVDVSVKTMQTVLRYPDEEVTWEAINQANTEMNLVTTYFDQPRNALVMKRVLLLGGGGQAAATIKAEIAFIAENAKVIMDGYIWPKG